ncbi:MAG TPA: RnfABCDGE type electron transport complex subunit D [Bacillota bacterium]|nr:RnfABCDGE type electron transport complex subunit D [Bacillota bacterium]
MKMMRGMLLALVPATVAGLWLYRWDALALIAVSMATAVGAEALWQLAAKTPVRIKDLSAAVTGLLFGLTLSPSLPLYLAAVGAALAIIAGKLLWGGFGKNVFNPVLFGRLLLVLLFPGTMAPWLTPVDMTATATPLQAFRAGHAVPPLFDLFAGNRAGCIGETSAIALLLGFGWLAYNAWANWRIPVAILGTTAVIALTAGQDPLFHLFSGSLLLGALFMATDPVTSPRYHAGRWVFGAGIAVIIMAMRFWSTFPEGTTFGILAMNMLVPLINVHTRPQGPPEGPKGTTGKP